MTTTAYEKTGAPYAVTFVDSSMMSRIMSLDVVRGLVMVLMALDHVRVYSGIPAGGPTPAIFFTRWVTHFCAPAFVFLAGTGAYLYGRTVRDSRALARYLAMRGILLVVLELTVIRFAWTFNLDYRTFVLAGVIWMLGWSMIILAGLVTLPAPVVGWIGLGIMACQQLFALIPRVLPDALRNSVGPVYEFMYPAGLPRASSPSILYVIVPWVGVMAAGYGFGVILTRERVQRDRLCRIIGLWATGLFLVASAAFASLAPHTPSWMPFALRMLNQNKYPPSQLYLLMTLGPMTALLPYAERARGRVARVLATFGRVPLFYYLLHIPLIHLLALGVNVARTGGAHSEWYAQAPFASVPDEQRWPLGLLYLVFVVAVAMLYPPCWWYARQKARGARAWLRYI
jgi:uncharacterized membrane protein